MMGYPKPGENLDILIREIEQLSDMRSNPATSREAFNEIITRVVYIAPVLAKAARVMREALLDLNKGSYTLIAGVGGKTVVDAFTKVEEIAALAFSESEDHDDTEEETH